MLDAKDFDDNVVFGGEEGGPTAISDIRADTKGNFDVLKLYVPVKSRLKGTMVDEGYEHQDETEVEVMLWIPSPDESDQTKKDKKIKSNNITIGKLTGEFVSYTEEEAWMECLPGGKYHDKILENSQVHVKVNGFNGNKNWVLEFNASKPKKQTFEDFKKNYLLRKQLAEEKKVESAF